jgi:hypothetical protein
VKKEPSPRVPCEDELKISRHEVHIKARQGRGDRERYYSADEFERLLELLRK